jgi:hypothetical protein
MPPKSFSLRKRKRAAKAAPRPDAHCPTCKRPITTPDVLRTAKQSAESVVALQQQVLRLTLIVAGMMKLHRGRVIIPMTDAAELGELRHKQNPEDGTVLLEAPAMQSNIILLNT